MIIEQERALLGQFATLFPMRGQLERTSHDWKGNKKNCNFAVDSMCQPLALLRPSENFQ